MKNRSVSFRLVTVTLIISALAAIAALGATSPAVKAFDSVKEFLGMAPTSQPTTTAPNQRLNAVAKGSMFTLPMEPMYFAPTASGLFQQDFATSTTVSTYVNASPNNGQFTQITTSGAGSTVTATGNKLNFTRVSGNTYNFNRSVSLGSPTTLIAQMDVAVSGNSVATSSSEAQWYFGTTTATNGFGDDNTSPSTANSYARMGIGWTATAGSWNVWNNNSQAGGVAGTYTGTKTITWVLNNSGSTASYRAPDGTNETIANDTTDIWVGTTKEFNDSAVATGTITAIDKTKFILTGSANGTISVDNIVMDPIPSTTTTSAATSVTATGFTANWSAVSGATAYRLDVATDVNFTSFVSGYNNLIVDGQATTSKAVTGLTGSTPYWYRVRAVKESTLPTGAEFGSGNSNVQNPTTSAPAVTYTVTYDGNGNTGGTVPVDANAYASGATATVLGNTGSLVKSGGYTFLTWGTSTDPNQTRRAPASTFTVSANTTLYALYSTTFTVNKAGNGSGSIAGPGALNNCATTCSVSADPSGTFNLSATASPGSTFTGWSGDCSGTGSCSLSALAPHNVTATFTADPHTVTFLGNNNTGGSTAAQTTNTTTNLTSNGFTRTGYTFTGWNTLQGGGGTAYANNASYDFSADLTLYAQWTINTYTLTYAAGSGGSVTGTLSQSVNHGSDGTAVTAVPDAGYKFVDWTPGNSTANPRTDTNVTASATYTANFALNDVTYGTGAANLPAGSYHDITVGNGAVITLTGNIVVTGTITVQSGGTLDMGGFIISGGGAFTIDGGGSLGIGTANGGIWKTAASGSILLTGTRTYSTTAFYRFYGDADSAVGDGLPTTVAGLTIENGSHTVTGNTVASPGQVVTGTLNIISGNYIGHSDYTDVVIGSGATLTLTDATTVSGNWTNNGGTLAGNFGVTFDGAGAQAIHGNTSFYDLAFAAGARTITFDAGSTQTATNSFTANGTAGNLITLRSSSSPTQWSISAPATAVSYLDVKDSNATSGLITATHSVNAAPGTTNTNWLFNYTINASTTAGGTVTPAGDTTVAFGGSQGYTITPNAGYAIASLVIDGGTIAAAPTYTFSTVSADHTISATFAVDNHTVTFNANGGSGSMANQVNNLPTALTTNTFTRTGYTFTGWNTAANGSGTGYANGATYPFTADATLYAQWAINNYTVTYDGNSPTSGTAPTSPGSGDYNTVIVLPGAGDLVKTGFSFGGWNTLADGTGTTYAAGANYTIPASNSILYAKWVANTFTLTATTGGNGNFKFGNIDANGVTTVNPGESRTYRIVPDFGYQIVDVLVDSVSVGKGQSYTFTNVQANHTISATFEAVTNRTLTAGTVNTYYDAVIDVPVSVSDTTGANITSFDFSLSYDENKLEPVISSGTNVTISNGTLGTWSGNVVKAATGIINVSRFSLSTPASGAGVLLYIKMHVKAHATTTAALTLDGQYISGSYGAFAPFNGGGVGANAAVAGVVNINPTATTTSVVTSGTPSTYGNSVTFTATVSTGGTPAVSGGAVTFYDGGSCGTPGATLGSANINGSGVAAISTAALSATGSPHTILACYGGVADFTASSGTVSQVVNPKPVTAAVTADNKVYDGNDTAVIATCTIPGKVGADDVACSAAGPNTFVNKNVGTGKTVTATNIALTGTTAGNYSLSATTATTTADITTLALTATVAANNKPYDGNATATINSCSFTNAIALDDVSCVTTGYAASFDNKNVGTSKPVTAAGLSKSGTDAGNYTFAGSGTGTADITAIALTATVDANSRAYNGNATATINSCSFAGVVGSEDVTCVTTGYSASFNNKNVGTAKPVTATGLTMAGADVGNYSFTGSGTGAADITAIALTATVDANSRAYNGNASASINSCSFTNAIALDDVSCVTAGYSARSTIRTSGRLNL